MQPQVYHQAHRIQRVGLDESDLASWICKLIALPIRKGLKLLSPKRYTLDIF